MPQCNCSRDRVRFEFPRLWSLLPLFGIFVSLAFELSPYGPSSHHHFYSRRSFLDVDAPLPQFDVHDAHWAFLGILGIFRGVFLAVPPSISFLTGAPIVSPLTLFSSPASVSEGPCRHPRTGRTIFGPAIHAASRFGCVLKLILPPPVPVRSFLLGMATASRVPFFYVLGKRDARRDSAPTSHLPPLSLLADAASKTN